MQPWCDLFGMVWCLCLTFRGGKKLVTFRLSKHDVRRWEEGEVTTLKYMRYFHKAWESDSWCSWLISLVWLRCDLAQLHKKKKKSSLDFSWAVKLSFSTVFLIRITSPQCALLLECLFWQCSGDAEWLQKQNPLKHYSPNSFLLTTLLVQFLVKWRPVLGDPEIKRKGCFTSGTATEVVTCVNV